MIACGQIMAFPVPINEKKSQRRVQFDGASIANLTIDTLCHITLYTGRIIFDKINIAIEVQIFPYTARMIRPRISIARDAENRHGRLPIVKINVTKIQLTFRPKLSLSSPVIACLPLDKWCHRGPLIELVIMREDNVIRTFGQSVLPFYSTVQGVEFNLLALEVCFKSGNILFHCQ